MRILLAVFGMLTLLPACGYAPHPKNGKLPCDNGCPDGYVCRADNRCWLTSTPAADSGAGGVQGTGGTTGAGGVTGAGGRIGTGGTTAAGGVTGTGGAYDVGGSSGSGGSSGTGGATGAIGSGGAVGTGGRIGTGGAIGTGSDASTTDGNSGVDASTDGAGGVSDSGGDTSATDAAQDAVVPVYPDGGTFVPLNAQSCDQPDGGALLCNGENCCTSINVPGGTFPQGRGTENCGSVGCQTGAGNEGCPNGITCPAEEQPEHPSTVSSFALDKYEVTVGRFRKFVAAYVSNTASAPVANAGVNPAIAGTGWQSGWNTSLPATQASFMDTSHLNCDATYQTWTNSPGTAAQENRAINCVNWYEAFAFCIWDGGRLATESEWEYAAAGGSENRLYPWGSAAPDCTYANFYPGYYCSGGSGSVVAVGSTPIGNSKWGHADLAGNVYEWAFDWYAAYSGSVSNNYANTTTSSGRVMRGDGFFHDCSATYLRAAWHGAYFSPDNHWSGVGPRCARTVQ
jgi:formylglycine-generating enzyme required for sulfatase activity